MVQHPRIILLGLPGSGKGTQGALIAQSSGVPTFSSGEYFRNLRREGKLPAEVAAKINAGGLVSDEDVNMIVVESFLSTQEAQAGFVLDGYPRTVAQAAFLDEYLTKQNLSLTAAVYVDLPDRDSVPPHFGTARLSRPTAVCTTCTIRSQRGRASATSVAHPSSSGKTTARRVSGQG